MPRPFNKEGVDFYFTLEDDYYHVVVFFFFFFKLRLPMKAVFQQCDLTSSDQILYVEI